MLTSEEPQVSDKARLSATATSKLLGISMSTLRLKAEEGYIRFSIGKNNRRVYTGADIKKFWRNYL